ncbi:class I SAM-dependent methyltransferase [Acinetobacter towneri]|uniref:class I SAM-dependent methyltransferase n=1 Tax=Acinetobacter towneri TaxID=202956 RepID=UPI001443DB60|nr:class I SAM-dependent methyltransferase [Acinetobacter towneri]
MLLPKFALTGKERFLDIGCGTGRWLHVLCEQVAYYHGIDASNGLIEIAKQQFDQPHIHLNCLNAENISLDVLSESQPFDRILNVGVMMYLNEPELQKYLSSIPTLLAEQGLFIVREPIALEKRLTLDLHYSEDMEQSYSAIYRTENELFELMNDAFDNKLKLIESDFVFKEAKLNHRAETKMKYFVFKKII